MTAEGAASAAMWLDSFLFSTASLLPPSNRNLFPQPSKWGGNFIVSLISPSFPPVVPREQGNKTYIETQQSRFPSLGGFLRKGKHPSLRSLSVPQLWLPSSKQATMSATPSCHTRRWQKKNQKRSKSNSDTQKRIVSGVGTPHGTSLRMAS